MNLIYTQVAGKLKEFITNIPNIGVPQKITQDSLASLGYKSSNDRTMVPVLKSLGIIGTDGVPTEHWQGLRDRANLPAYLAMLIKQAYSELYVMFPEAHLLPDQRIRDFLASKSKAGERMVQMAVATFKTLTGLANFSQDAILIAEASDIVDTPMLNSRQTNPASTKQAVSSQGTLSLTLNISIGSDTQANAIKAIFDGICHLQGIRPQNEVGIE